MLVDDSWRFYHIDLHRLLSEMKEGIEVRNRKQPRQVFRDCFTLRDSLSFMVEKKWVLTSHEALSLLQHLQNIGYIEAVFKPHKALYSSIQGNRESESQETYFIFSKGKIPLYLRKYRTEQILKYIPNKLKVILARKANRSKSPSTSISSGSLCIVKSIVNITANDGTSITEVKSKIEELRDHSHPHIAMIENIHLTSKECYVTLTLVQGLPILQGLSQYYHSPEQNSFQLYEAIQKVILQVLSCLRHLEELGIHYGHIPLKKIILSPQQEGKVHIQLLGVDTSILSDHYKGIPEGTYLTPPEISEDVSPSIDDSQRGIPTICAAKSSWYFGIFLFTLLYGQEPFRGNNQDQMDLFKEGYSPFEFLSECPGTDFGSPEAKDLINKLLHNTPSERLSLDKVTTHPFFSQTGGDYESSSPVMIKKWIRMWETIYSSPPISGSESKGNTSLPLMNQSFLDYSPTSSNQVRSFPVFTFSKKQSSYFFAKGYAEMTCIGKSNMDFVYRGFINSFISGEHGLTTERTTSIPRSKKKRFIASLHRAKTTPTERQSDSTNPITRLQEIGVTKDLKEEELREHSLPTALYSRRDETLYHFYPGRIDWNREGAILFSLYDASGAILFCESDGILTVDDVIKGISVFKESSGGYAMVSRSVPLLLVLSGNWSSSQWMKIRSGLCELKRKWSVIEMKGGEKLMELIVDSVTSPKQPKKEHLVKETIQETKDTLTFDMRKHYYSPKKEKQLSLPLYGYGSLQGNVLADTLYKFDCLQVLDFRFISFIDKQWKTITESLPCLLERNLRCLQFTNCPLGREKIISVIEILAQVTSHLRVLILSNVSCDSSGAEFIGHFLTKQDCPLHCLDLSGNHMGDHGVSSLLISSTINKNLRSLRLHNVGMSCQSALHVGQLIQANTNLRRLDISHNIMGPHSLVLMEEAFSSSYNYSLCEFLYPKSLLYVKEHLLIQKRLELNRIITRGDARVTYIIPHPTGENQVIYLQPVINADLISSYRIRRLVLCGLGLVQIPTAIGGIPFLEELILSRNSLDSYIVPQSLAKRLSLVDLSSNKFSKLPCLEYHGSLV